MTFPKTDQRENISIIKKKKDKGTNIICFESIQFGHKTKE